MRMRTNNNYYTQGFTFLMKELAHSTKFFVQNQISLFTIQQIKLVWGLVQQQIVNYTNVHNDELLFTLFNDWFQTVTPSERSQYIHFFTFVSFLIITTPHVWSNEDLELLSLRLLENIRLNTNKQLVQMIITSLLSFTPNLKTLQHDHVNPDFFNLFLQRFSNQKKTISKQQKNISKSPTKTSRNKNTKNNPKDTIDPVVVVKTKIKKNKLRKSVSFSPKQTIRYYDKRKSVIQSLL
jgi:hypothetical protein